MRTRDRSRIIRRRGMAWTVEALPADPWRSFCGVGAADSAAGLAAHWPTFGGTPPRDSEPARRTPLPGDKPKPSDDPAGHNRGVRRAARQRRRAR